MKNPTIAIVNILAAQIRKAAPGTTRSQSMSQAWALVKKAGDAKLLVFTKKSGTTERRIVTPTWGTFYTPVGGTSTNAPGQLLFCDLCKVATGESRVIISTYSENILTAAV